MRFSVIIPTLGRDESLARTLDALAKQTFPRPGYEIIVAFDGAVPSPGIMPILADQHVLVVRSVVRAGPGAARNLAVRSARGEFLAFTEDDCIPSPDWLARAASRLDQGPDVDVVDGETVRTDGSIKSHHVGGAPEYLPTNLIVRRSTFEAVGGYSEAFFDAGAGLYFREDSDFGFSLEAANARIVVDQEVLVTHPVEHERFLDPIRWARRYEMDPLLARRHPARFRDRIEVVDIAGRRVRRPFVRACLAYLLGLVIIGLGAATGLSVAAWTGVTLVVLALIVMWAKWHFALQRLPVLPIVPFVLMDPPPRSIPGTT